MLKISLYFFRDIFFWTGDQNSIFPNSVFFLIYIQRVFESTSCKLKMKNNLHTGTVAHAKALLYAWDDAYRQRCCQNVCASEPNGAWTKKHRDLQHHFCGKGPEKTDDAGSLRRSGTNQTFFPKFLYFVGLLSLNKSSLGNKWQ